MMILQLKLDKGGTKPTPPRTLRMVSTFKTSPIVKKNKEKKRHLFYEQGE